MRVPAALPLRAGAPVAPRRIVKFSGDDIVVQAAAAADALIGVSDSLGAAAAGDQIAVYASGDQVEIEVGAAGVTRGLEFTSDALGRAVNAAPAAGATCRTGGIAMGTYVQGDIGLFRLAPSSKTTPV